MAERVLTAELHEHIAQTVRLEGWVHRLRDLGGVRFLALRDRRGIGQIIVPRTVAADSIGCETVVRVVGHVRSEPRAPGGVELLAERLEILSQAAAPPLDVFKPLTTADYRLDTLLEHRAVSLRIPALLDVFRVEAQILTSFRAYLSSQGFTEITTPKLVLAGAEGGSALFEVRYFDRKAYLAQSPQFYKQIMVGSGLERVFEVGHVYRAEKSETSRHLTEFVGLDFEMGFIESVQDVIRMHAALITAIFADLLEHCGEIIARHGIELPRFDEIPQVSFCQARQILAEQFNKRDGLDGDLDTEGEQLMCQWAKSALGSDLLYVTGYAMHKRPLYTMPDAADPQYSASFDLLFRGVEITTGGQRVHDYEQLCQALTQGGHDLAEFEDYLVAFRHGMPPHGGMGMGLERLAKQIFGLSNVKQACLFPRDRYRLRP
jgi:nondiscriminating aspartyl-tRNA synthetase